MARSKDLTGKRFGKLTALNRNYDKLSSKRHCFWSCVCDYGKNCIVRSRNLIAGITKSCGCYRKIFRQKPIDEIFKNAYYRKYKIDAAKKNKVFLLTQDEFLSIVTQSCHYCGKYPEVKSTLIPKYNNKTFAYNGIDRIDSNIGYKIKNCLPCCSTCNFGKRNMKYEDFIEYLSRLVEFRSKL